MADQPSSRPSLTSPLARSTVSSSMSLPPRSTRLDDGGAPSTPGAYGARDALSSSVGEAAASGIVNQLKNNLVNVSAELLITKGRNDELERDKKRLAAQLADAQAAHSTAAAEARAGVAEREKSSALASTVAKLNADLRSAAERIHSFEDELDRERSSAATLRAQFSALQREQGDAAKDAAARARATTDQLAAARAEIADFKARELGGSRDKEELQLKLELALRTNSDLEAGLESARRDHESFKSRLAGTVRDSESAQSQSAATITNLQKQRSELQASNSALDASLAAAKSKNETLAAAKAKADSDAARLTTSLELAQAERDRIASRWKEAMSAAAESEATALSLKSALADMQTQLHIARSKEGSGGSGAPGRSGRFDESLASALDAESAQVAALRRTLRELEAEKELASDILSSVIPLPAFVKERAAESEGTLLAAGTSRSAAAKAAGGGNSSAAWPSYGAGGGDDGGSVMGETASVAGGGSPFRGGDSASVLGVATSSAVVTQLRAMAAERPLIIDALTFMDLQLRAMRVEKERLSSQLDSSKGAETASEANLSSLRRQLSTSRQEIASIADARDAALDRAARSEAEVRTRTSELNSAKESLRAEVTRREDVSRRLEEVRTELASALDDARHLRARGEAVRSDFEAQLAVSQTTLENVQNLAAAAAEDAKATHTSVVQGYMGRMGTLEGELDAARHDLATLSARFASTTNEFDKARADVAAHSAKVAGLEMALAQAEATHRSDMELAREGEAARSRLLLALEAAVDERDVTHNKLTSTAGEVAIMRNRLDELEALDALHREDEERIASLTARCNDMDSLLGQSQAETESAEQRVAALREQSHVDLELANASTARVAAELQRIMRAREEDANASVALADASRRSLAQLREEGDATAHEAAQLRERCRALQTQLAALAAEVQEARDNARFYHDESMQAKADHAAEVERSSALHRATLEQLETIKADFYSFLSMFHPEEAAAAAAAGGSSRSLPIASPVATRTGSSITRSPTSATASAIVNTLTSDMDDLRRRLGALAASARVASVSTTRTPSTSLYRS